MVEDIQIFSGIVSSGPAFILTELHIQDPMELVFNTPMAAFSFQYLRSCHSFAAIDEVVCPLWFLPVFLCFRENNADPLQIRPFLSPLQP